MIRLFIYCLIIFFTASAFAPAQSSDADWDIDSIFDEEPSEDISQDINAPPNTDTAAGNVLSEIFRRKGFSFEASASLVGGLSFGWPESPWNWNEEYSPWTELDSMAGAGMSGNLGLDFQFSDVLRVKNGFVFYFPDYAFVVSEFFIDYNLFDKIYFRAGKTNITWGQSRNYTFTNLPARVPVGRSNWGDSVILKADIPIGIGGLQFLGLVRPGFMESSDQKIPNIKEIAYGAKFNLAIRRLDMDIGLLFHKDMPLRSFISLKTTAFDFELYADGLYTYQFNQDIDRHGGAFSFGGLRDFFGGKLTVNLEAFYNKDIESYYYQEKDVLQEAKAISFIEGWNGAVNIIVRPVDYKSFRAFVRCLYSFETYSAWFVPGLSITPLPHINVYLTVPMALGPRNGPYYTKNDDIRNRPFSIMLGVNVSGSYSFGHYE